MEKYNIKKDNLCIKKILTVVRGNNPNHHKKLSVKDRHSDAFVFVVDGSCIYRFDDGIEFTAKKGDVFYLPYQSAYTMYIITENYRFIFCDFKFEEEPTEASLFSSEHLINAKGLFIKLLNSYRSPSVNKQTECMSVLYNVYNLLQRTHDERNSEKKPYALVENARRYLEHNFNDSGLSFQHLATEANMSEVYFRRLFKEQNGTSPVKYLNSLRIKNAIDLMKYPFLSLEECALQSGFSSLQYFCRVFKKEFNISPGRFRERL